MRHIFGKVISAVFFLIALKRTPQYASFVASTGYAVYISATAACGHEVVSFGHAINTAARVSLVFNDAVI